MDFSFGIITGGGKENFINEIIDSIERESIPHYEIIIIGSCNIKRLNTTVFAFDESIKPNWITRKKNLITYYTKFENIVYMHDFIKLNAGWYAGHSLAGNDFYVRMDKIINFDGTRFRDWCIWPHNGNFMDGLIGRECLIPYYLTHLSKYQYISGSYWVAKKKVMMQYPLDERLSWGEGEDVLWSKLVREKYNFDMNVNSSVQIMKPDKHRVFNEPNEILIHKLKELHD
jgi:hypothetical protein